MQMNLTPFKNENQANISAAPPPLPTLPHSIPTLQQTPTQIQQMQYKYQQSMQNQQQQQPQPQQMANNRLVANIAHHSRSASASPK